VLAQVREPVGPQHPVPVGGALRQQPHGAGDEPEGVAVLQVDHAPREHLALEAAAPALQRPLQVAQAQRPRPETQLMSHTR